MKVVAAIVMLGIMSASGGTLVRDRFTGFSYDNAAWLAAHDPSITPGWSLGSKPFGHWMGSWEVVPSFGTRMVLGISVEIKPTISLDKPIHLTLQ